MMKNYILGLALIAISGAATAEDLIPGVSVDDCITRVQTAAAIGSIAENCLLNDEDTRNFERYHLSTRDRDLALSCAMEFNKTPEGRVIVLQSIVSFDDAAKKSIAKQGREGFCKEYGITIRNRPTKEKVSI